jgi:antibiotic biosynthesis monooxygenase (ABM) superfamily enzyme
VGTPEQAVVRPTSTDQHGASLVQRLIRRIVTTLIVWAAAFLVVSLVFVLGGETLANAPGPVRALVVSGILVVLMVNLLMPVLGRLIGRLFGGR